jgi:hypothetical protein
VATLLDAALRMLAERKWFSIPLGLDSNNLPKKPLPLEWTNLDPTEEVLRSLPWGAAKGLGLVLGEKSNNLGVLDIDDEDLFNLLIPALCFDEAYRLVRTARNRGHWYFQMEEHSPSTWREVTWRGRSVKVELKAHGTQVAAPPTNGYKLLNQNPPKRVSDMEMAFEFFCDIMLDFAPNQFSYVEQQQLTPANYPQPWQPEVKLESRNKSIYLEAHKLREAGVPYDQALPIMEARFQAAYEKGGMAWQEIENTIRSAYRKGVVTRFYEGGGDELSIFSH